MKLQPDPNNKNILTNRILTDKNKKSPQNSKQFCQYLGSSTGQKVGSCQGEMKFTCNHSDGPDFCIPDVVKSCNKNAIAKQNDKTKFRDVTLCSGCPLFTKKDVNASGDSQ